MDIIRIGASCCGDAKLLKGFDRVLAPCVCLAACTLQTHARSTDADAIVSRTFLRELLVGLMAQGWFSLRP
jgi:hypothetical protein